MSTNNNTYTSNRTSIPDINSTTTNETLFRNFNSSQQVGILQQNLYKISRSIDYKEVPLMQQHQLTSLVPNNKELVLPSIRNHNIDSKNHPLLANLPNRSTSILAPSFLSDAEEQHLYGSHTWVKSPSQVDRHFNSFKLDSKLHGNNHNAFHYLRPHFSFSKSQPCERQDNNSMDHKSSASTSSKITVKQKKRKRGRKNMNLSNDEKRERNRNAVRRCRERQTAKLNQYIQKKDQLMEENVMLKTTTTPESKTEAVSRWQITSVLQIEVLYKLRDIYHTGKAKDFLHSINLLWEDNASIVMGLPGRTYDGHDKVKNYWRNCTRNRKNGKLNLFSWLFDQQPGNRFSEFSIDAASAIHGHYVLNWRLKQYPIFSGSIYILFGPNNRILHQIQCLDWLMWDCLTGKDQPNSNQWADSPRDNDEN